MPVEVTTEAANVSLAAVDIISALDFSLNPSNFDYYQLHQRILFKIHSNAIHVVQNVGTYNILTVKRLTFRKWCHFKSCQTKAKPSEH